LPRIGLRDLFLCRIRRRRRRLRRLLVRRARDALRATRRAQRHHPPSDPTLPFPVALVRRQVDKVDGQRGGEHRLGGDDDGVDDRAADGVGD
jgi:hypothetical protein